MAEKDKIESDYDYSRKTYYELIEKGKESLELMIEVARESEHPRAFEVLSGMVKNISDVNDRLMDLNKKNKDILKVDKEEETKHITTNNNVFLGSAADLQRMLKDEAIDVTPNNNDAE
jgi:t-SNARE complex subunit (syntaxin)